MPTLEELQDQIESLKQQVDAITAPPDEYYTLQYSGEEVDQRLSDEGDGTVKTVAGVSPDPNGNVNLTAMDVGAAPKGFGLGESSAKPIEDFNDALQSGWYYTTSGDIGVAHWPDGMSRYCLIRTDCRGSSAYQTAYDYGTMAVRFTNQTSDPEAWKPWEWVNPPMQIGVEYRTIERYDGKPVYAKLVDCGNMPNKTSKTVSGVFTSMKDVCLLIGSMRIGSTGGFLAVNDQVLVNNNATGIQITTTEDYSAWTLRVLVKYTKTTD